MKAAPEGGIVFSSVREWISSWSGDLALWRDHQETQSALKKFDALGGTEKDRYLTIARMASACQNARQYQPDTDPGQIYRNRLAHQRTQLDALARAARVLAKACERGDRAMVYALPGGANRLSVRLTRPHDGATTAIQEMGAAWFSELEQRILGTIPELHGGPFWHRFTVGNLHFERPLRSGRPIEVTSMLAFELSFYLRMFTAGRARDIKQSAQRHPRYGKPCCHIVADLCNATLGANLDAKMIGDRLRKLPPDVGLIEWPKRE